MKFKTFLQTNSLTRVLCLASLAMLFFIPLTDAKANTPQEAAVVLTQVNTQMSVVNSKIIAAKQNGTFDLEERILYLSYGVGQRAAGNDPSVASMTVQKAQSYMSNYFILSPMLLREARYKEVVEFGYLMLDITTSLEAYLDGDPSILAENYVEGQIPAALRQESENDTTDDSLLNEQVNVVEESPVEQVDTGNDTDSSNTSTSDSMDSGSSTDDITDSSDVEATVSSEEADQHRKKDLDKIASAMNKYYSDHGTFKLTGGGYDGKGNGWFNYAEGPYPDSAHSVLRNKGYLNEDITGPAGDHHNYSGSKIVTGYMIISNAQGSGHAAGQAFTLWANLHEPSSSDRSTQDVCLHSNYDNYRWSFPEHMRMNYCISGKASAQGVKIESNTQKADSGVTTTSSSDSTTSASNNDSTTTSSSDSTTSASNNDSTTDSTNESTTSESRNTIQQSSPNSNGPESESGKGSQAFQHNATPSVAGVLISAQDVETINLLNDIKEFLQRL